jgi:hypothetical protein
VQARQLGDRRKARCFSVVRNVVIGPSRQLLHRGVMSAIGGQADASTRSFAIALENKGPYLAHLVVLSSHSLLFHLFFDLLLCARCSPTPKAAIGRSTPAGKNRPEPLCAGHIRRRSPFRGQLASNGAAALCLCARTLLRDSPLSLHLAIFPVRTGFPDAYANSSFCDHDHVDRSGIVARHISRQGLAMRCRHRMQFSQPLQVGLVEAARVAVWSNGDGE